MNSNLFIIIGLLLGLIMINFIYKNNVNQSFNNNDKSHLKNNSDNESDNNSDNDSLESITIDVSISMDNVDKLNKLNKYKNNNFQKKAANFYNNDEYIDNNVNSQMMKNYLQKYVLSGRAQDYDNDNDFNEQILDKTKTKATREEINEYRDQMIGFNDRINGSSNDYEDPVDKMNMINLQGGIQGNGMKISQYFDQLTSNPNDTNYNLNNLTGFANMDSYESSNMNI